MRRPDVKLIKTSAVTSKIRISPLLVWSLKIYKWISRNGLFIYVYFLPFLDILPLNYLFLETNKKMNLQILFPDILTVIVVTFQRYFGNSFKVEVALNFLFPHATSIIFSFSRCSNSKWFKLAKFEFYHL